MVRASGYKLRGLGFDSRLYHGDFPCEGRIPVVTMVWVVSRIRFKFETSLTRNHTSINSWLNPRQRSPRWSGPHHERQPAHQLIEYPSTLIADYGKRKRRRRKKEFCSEFWRFFLPQVYSCRPVQGQVQGCVSQAIQLLSILFSGTYFRYSFNTWSSVTYAYIYMFVRLCVTFHKMAVCVKLKDVLHSTFKESHPLCACETYICWK